MRATRPTQTIRSMPEKRTHNLLRIKVLQVHDGDTFIGMEVGGPIAYKVRCGDVNAIELSKAGGVTAKEFIEKEILGTTVGLELRHQLWDQYGRRLGVVWYGKDYEKNLADELIKRNLAVPDPTKMPAPE